MTLLCTGGSNLIPANQACIPFVDPVVRLEGYMRSRVPDVSRETLGCSGEVEGNEQGLAPERNHSFETPAHVRWLRLLTL